MTQGTGGIRWRAKRLVRRLPVGAFVRGVATLVSGTMIGRAVVVLTSPLLTRLYTPEEFGLLAVYLAFLGTFGVIAGLQYDVAVVLPASRRTAANLFVLSLLIACGMSVIVGFAVAVAGGPLVTRLNVAALEPYLWLLPPGLLAVGAYQTLSRWAIRKRAFGRLARTKIAQGVGQAAIQLGWGLAAGGPLGLLLGGAFGQAAGMTTLAAVVRREDRRVFRAVNLRTMRRVMWRYRRFPTLATGSAFLNAANRHLPALLLAALYGPQGAGWYALGQRVVRTPTRLVGTAVAQVYISEAAPLARRDMPALRPLIARITGRMLLLGGVPLGAVALGGPWLFDLVFGPAWGDAGRYVQVLAVTYLAQFAVAPVTLTLPILERQDVQLLWNVVQVTATGLLFWLGYWLAWPPLGMLAAYSASMVASHIGVFALVWYSIPPRRPAADRGLPAGGVSP